MDVPHLDSIAAGIDTGRGDESVARVLVVFNLTPDVFDGIAAFPAEIGWPADKDLPAITVRPLDDPAAPACGAFISSPTFAPDGPGRVRVSFNLLFPATDVPAGGWRCYSAAYQLDRNAGQSTTTADDRPPIGSVFVVETGFHSGHLNIVGTSARLRNQSSPT
ncbi:MAG: hypothetical protein ACLQVD_15475 [Capsulimonadaceae bacterium]